MFTSMSFLKLKDDEMRPFRANNRFTAHMADWLSLAECTSLAEVGERTARPLQKTVVLPEKIF